MSNTPAPTLPNTSTCAIPVINSEYVHPHAELILRSADGVDFHVFKVFLSYSSPLFREMFTLPQPPSTDAATTEALPVVSVTEKSRVLAFLLAYCYPRGMRLPENLEDLLSVLEPARKYGMDNVERCIKETITLPKFIDTQPLRVFILALYHGLEDEARIAAKKTLSYPLMGRGYIPELEYITAGQHHFLQEYHLKCGERASAVAQNLTWIKKDTYVWFDCTECRNHRPSLTFVRISDNRNAWVMAKWWLDYIREAGTALAERPSGLTVTTELMDEALKKACLCAVCRVKAFSDMREFSQLFAKEVEKAISEVELVLKMRNIH